MKTRFKKVFNRKKSCYSLKHQVYLLVFFLIFTAVFFIFPKTGFIYPETKIPFIPPVKGEIILGFRETYYNFEKEKYYKHTGIDIKGDNGQSVAASANGFVSYIGISPVGGNTVVIRHNEKIRTTYLNLSEILVKRGEYVRQGQVIGTIGARDDPSSESIHLHFGVIYDNAYLDPEDLFSIDYTDISRFIFLKYLRGDYGIY